MLLSENRKIKHDYQILETFEAGLVLSGPEVKAAKAGQFDLKGAYIFIDGRAEAWLVNAYLAPYQPARSAQKNYQPNQNRKLLLTKKEINTLIGKQSEKKFTLVPLRVYTKNGLVKIEIAVARGKKKFDKRESIKKREFERKKQQIM